MGVQPAYLYVMTRRGSITPVLTVSILALGLLWIWTRFADLWAPSLAFYAGFLLLLAGLVSLAIPLGVFGIRTRRGAARIAVAGLTIGAASVLWPGPAERQSSNRGTELDRMLPEFDRSERHEIRVRGTVEQVRQAMDAVTFSDIKGLRTLMTLRTMKRVGSSSRPMLATMTAPGANFLRLASTNEEFVAGNVGRPWAGQKPIVVLDAGQFRDLAAPGAVKIAFNMRVEPAEPGWCKVSTETRILATDEEARKAFTRYWCVIYPGSALVRVMWLDALQRRVAAQKA